MFPEESVAVAEIAEPGGRAAGKTRLIDGVAGPVGRDAEGGQQVLAFAKPGGIGLGTPEDLHRVVDEGEPNSVPVTEVVVPSVLIDESTG